MKNQPHIIFMNRFFYPDHSATSQLLSDLAFDLSQKEYDIQIITSRQSYDNKASGLRAFEIRKGVKIYRVRSAGFGRAYLAGRAIDYLFYYIFAAWKLWRIARKGDIVVVKTDPPLLSVIIAPLVWLRGAKLVNWLQDLFPEVAQVLGIGNGRFGRVGIGFLKYLRNRSLHGARKNIVLGKLMHQKLLEEGIAKDKIQVMPNWSDGDQIKPVPMSQNPLRKEWGLENSFVVGYSGNFGRAHDFETILETMKRLSKDKAGARIRFLFIGNGAQQEHLQHAVKDHRLKNVLFQPYQPRSRLAHSLSVPDLHLVSLLPDIEGLIVPSKFYGIAAAGRPTAYIGDPGGEIPNILREHQCGFTVASGQDKKLAHSIMEMASTPAQCEEMGQRARRLFERDYDKKIAFANWKNLLAEMGA